MEIIDSHVHFWDPARFTYAWLDEVPAIHRAYLPEDYGEASHGVEVKAMVFVEADCHPDQALDEVRWIESLAATEPRLRGIIAAAPMERGTTVRPHLQRLAERPLVKGVRRLIQGEGPGFCTAKPFIQAVRLLPEFDLSFDLCLKHPQLPEIITLVQACPETGFVLDHIGKPAIAAGQLDPWRRHIDLLATLPNLVGCKLSGLITEADWRGWTEEDLQPYVEHVLRAFAPSRLLYGSDWPVSILAGGYAPWWQALTRLTDSSFDRDSRAAALGETAKRVYEL